MNRSTKNIIGVAIIVIGLLMMFRIGFDTNSKFGGNNETQGKTGSSTAKENMSGIDHIIINGTSEDINMTTYDGKEIIVNMTAEASFLKKSKAELRVRKKNNEISITVDYPKFDMFSNNDVKLDIQLPKTYNEDMSIDLTSGELTMADGVELKHLVIDITSGEIVFADVKADETSIEATSGTIDLVGDLGDLKGDMTSGKVSVTYDEFHSDIKFEMTSGNLDIILDKNAEFNLDADLTSGDLDCEFELQNRVEKDKDVKGSVGNSSNNIDLHLTSGNVDITKK